VSIAAFPQASGRAPSRVGLIGRGVILESVRRREIYVLLLLMGLFVVGALVVRMVGIENAATGTFLLNLGLTLAAVFAQLATLLTAARQFPDELETRTIYPLLGKPVARGQYIAGKWLGCVVIGWLTLLVLSLLAWLPTPKMETYFAGTLLQMLLLQIVAVAAIAAWALGLSLYLPKAVTVVIVALLVLASGRVGSLVESWIQTDATRKIVSWLLGYIPDFSQLDLVQRYTDGIHALSLPVLGARLLYGIAITVFPLAFASWAIGRRSL